MARPDDIRLGQLLIRKRWCTLRQVNAGFEIQSRLKEKGKSRPLGSILVREEFVDLERLKMGLSELGTLRLVCPTCRREKPISNYDSEKSYRCSTCRESLVFEEELDETASPDRFGEKSPGASHRGASTTGATLDDDTAGADQIIGRVVGGCQVLGRIASGGMGVVYKAKQIKLGRIVAVKVLSEELARDRNYVHRFLQEARSAAELNHGNIVHIIDVGEINGLFYILMEYVDGSNLREILDVQKRLKSVRVVEIALQASQALNHAHRRGIIHRDIKPENIMITREGVVKIADLGLAKNIHPDHQDGGITQTSAIMGTPYYMAPEQIRDFRQVDGRTDIYSLGVTLFRALTGSAPFDGRTPVEVMMKVVEGKRPTVSFLRPDVLPELEAIVDRMMARSPAERFQTFVDVTWALDEALQRINAGSTSPTTP